MLQSQTRVPSNAAHSVQPQSFASSAKNSLRFDRYDRPLNALASPLSLHTSRSPPTYVMAALYRL